MKKAIVAGGIALMLASVMSGCFLTRELTWSKDKVSPGDKVTASISITPTAEISTALKAFGPGLTIYPFFQMGVLGDAESPTIPTPKGPAEAPVTLSNGGKFDTTGQFGGPSKLVRNLDLAAQLDTTTCQTAGPRKAATSKGIVPVDDAVVAKDPFVTDNPRKLIESKLPVKIAQGLEPSVPMLVFTPGIWTDDGDGVPEAPGSSGDTYSCGSPYTTSLVVK